MSAKHRDLAEGRWAQFSFVEQMANIGSEFGRALKWKRKGNETYCKNAVYRALELIGLTIEFNKVDSHYKELTRLREFTVDYFLGSNQFHSTEEQWQIYFYHFNYASRKNT